jgi:hypothetical protein
MVEQIREARRLLGWAAIERPGLLRCETMRDVENTHTARI